MDTEPQIQIEEQYNSFMEAPEVEVVAWWSLANVDQYTFVESDPARGSLELESGVRRYDTEYGTVTERLDDPRVPPTVRQRLSEEGYSFDR